MRASPTSRCTTNFPICVRFDSSRHILASVRYNNNKCTAYSSFCAPKSFLTANDRVDLNETIRFVIEAAVKYIYVYIPVFGAFRMCQANISPMYVCSEVDRAQILLTAYSLKTEEKHKNLFVIRRSFGTTNRNKVPYIHSGILIAITSSSFYPINCVCF